MSQRSSSPTPRKPASPDPGHNPGHNPELQRRIEGKVAVNEAGCWMWTAARHPYGYGLIRVGSRQDNTRRMEWVHRLVYTLYIGAIPEGYEVTHRCGRNFSCVNPDHLIALPHAEVVRLGLLPTINLSKTICPNGHDYTPENTYIYPSGRRQCRICRREGVAKLRDKRNRACLNAGKQVPVVPDKPTGERES